MSYPYSEASSTPGTTLAIYPFQEPAAPRTLIDILDETTLTHPTALALDNGSQRLTYEELADQVASRVKQLWDAGIGIGDRVGVRISSGSLELYVCILAVLAAGAAYVPVDADDPDERAELVWTEASVCAVLTDNTTLTKHGSCVDGPQDFPGPEDDAWIIFTSGSTGKPKGVAVSHRSAAAFVDAEADLFLPEKPIGPGDRVLAGLSVAFDASCEEMWLAWRSGACLVPVPRSLVKAGADLGAFLTSQNISVVSTVPTLAALWPTASLKNLRLLILGGEACSPELAWRLTNAVESVWNTYGPTEATVVSCGAPLIAGELVSIGTPLPGWKLAVVSSDGVPVLWGEEGELIIGGVGMARYLDPEKDQARFRPAACFGGERAYRTGDWVRANPDGLTFVGRNDEQIKLGGRRVELGEIDAALMSLPGVSAAASAVRLSETGCQLLVGYVVRDGGDEAKLQSDMAAKRALLRRSVPATLIPMIVTVDDIPVRTSGKVDRSALPWPPPDTPCASEHSDDSCTRSWLAEQWRLVLGVAASPDSDFFNLGGTSLTAAQLVSQVRQRCPKLSVADVYENPVLRDMAARVDDLSVTKPIVRDVTPTPRWLAVVQFAILLVMFAFEGIRWLTALAMAKNIFALRLGPDSWAGHFFLPWWMVGTLWVIFMSMPGRMLTTAAVVRILTMNIRRGIYRRAGGAHIRIWAAERFVALQGINAIAGTQWCQRYAWLIGCYVGREAQIHTLPPVTGLASFGACSATEAEADVAGWWLDGDLLHIGTVSIGEGATVGARCVLMPNSVLEPFAVTRPGTCIRGTVRGAYAPPSMDEKGSIKSEETFLGASPFWSDIRYTLSLLLLDLFPLIMIVPVGCLTFIWVHDYSNYKELVIGFMEMALPGTVLGVFLYAFIVIILVRLANFLITPGVYSWYGSTAWAAWFIHYLMEDAREVLFPIYASLFTPKWLGFLGARVGRNVEMSTVVPIPNLITIKDGAFLADDVLLTPFELDPTCKGLRLGTAEVGAKSFVGNSAIVDPDITIPDAVLISTLGSAPSPDESHMAPGSSWLGRPPMSIPRRVDAPADERRTYNPPTRLVIARAFVEACRLFPLLISAMLETLVGIGLMLVMYSFGLGWAILVAPGLLLAAGLTACSVATLAKWILTPNIKPGHRHPLWSYFVWRNELADTFIQSLAAPWLIRSCYGTAFLNMWMRSLGAKIGRGVWLESHLLPEPELVQLDDGATINRGCVLQTHMFHDRLMRLDSVHLQKGATLGPYAITLPGTTIGAGTSIGPTSLVMRGERIPAGTRWVGNPVRPWDEATKLESASSSDSGSIGPY